MNIVIGVCLKIGQLGRYLFRVSWEQLKACVAINQHHIVHLSDVAMIAKKVDNVHS